MRPRISPARRRCTASGFIRISERSTAIERGSLLRAPPSSRRSRLERGEVDRSRLDRRLAIRTDLPEGLEGRLAVDACLLQLRRAHGTDEKVRADLRAADRAVEVAAGQPLLHRLDLELALPHVLEVLRRAEEHVDEGPDERRDKPEHDGHRDQDRVLDAALRVLVHPVADGEPENDQEENEQVSDDLPGPGGKEVVDPTERACDHRRILPIKYPARNASPTIATSTNVANAKTVSLSPTFAIVRSHPLRDRPVGKGNL